MWGIVKKAKGGWKHASILPRTLSALGWIVSQSRFRFRTVLCKPNRLTEDLTRLTALRPADPSGRSTRAE